MEGLTPDHLRLRSKIHSGFFGQILRANEQVGGGKSKAPPREKTLKQLNIKDRSSLVIQILKDPEILENDENILLFSLRNREK
jgi:hypothetical protein